MNILRVMENISCFDRWMTLLNKYASLSETQLEALMVRCLTLV